MPNDDIHDMKLISEGIHQRQRERRRHKSGDKFQHPTSGCKYVKVKGQAGETETAFSGDRQNFYPVNPRCRSRTLERGKLWRPSGCEYREIVVELVKACTLPRDGGETGEKGRHMTSLHNLCENNNMARTRHQHHHSLAY